MRIALEVWTSNFSLARDTCLRAESLGFDGFYYGESPTGLNLDCWTTLAALARDTTTIRLGPVISNILPQYRSLLLLAKQAATVAIAADGRLDFRTGVGAATHHGRQWWRPYGIDYPNYENRLNTLTHSLPALRALWAGKSTVVAPSDDQPVELGFSCPPIPITVAATGTRAMSVARRHAHWWETSFHTPTSLAIDVARFEAFASASWPEPGPACSLEIDGFVGTTDQRARAVITSARAEREAAGEDMDPVFSRGLVGPPAQVADQLQALADAGAEQLVVALHDPHDADALTALAQARTLAALD